VFAGLSLDLWKLQRVKFRNHGKKVGIFTSHGALPTQRHWFGEICLTCADERLTTALGFRLRPTEGFTRSGRWAFLWVS
jgi:hypothetical protein